MGGFLHSRRHLTVLLYIFSDGCPKDCSNHGECRRFGDVWQCDCRDGWKGEACNLARETKCNDDKDNDEGKKFKSPQRATWNSTVVQIPTKRPHGIGHPDLWANGDPFLFPPTEGGWSMMAQRYWMGRGQWLELQTHPSH